MALNIELKKKLQFQLEKKELTEIVARVGFCCDVSGSMRNLYLNGTMSKVNERLLVIANRFDDNQEMDMKIFDEESFDLPGMTEDNFVGYVDKYIINGDNHIWGCTYYAQSIKKFADDWFPSNETRVVKKAGFFSKLLGGQDEVEIIPTEEMTPAFLMMQTDGINHDPVETEHVLRSIQNLDMYVTFLGVGRDNFEFLRTMADKYPNVGFLPINDLEKVTDDELYEGLITDELATWLKKSVISN